MQIEETFFEDDSDSGSTQVKTFSPQEFSDYFQKSIYCKEIELNSLTPTKVDFQTQLKNDPGSYRFIITASQQEMESLVKLFYWSDDMSWIPQFELIPKKGLKLRRIATQEKRFITEVSHNSITLCSPEGDFSRVNYSALHRNYELLP